MSAGPSEEALPDESLTEQKLNVLFCPLLGREGLEEHHDFLCEEDGQPECEG